jgi:two-component system, response regulator
MNLDSDFSDKTILLVEDNPDERELTLQAFAQAYISSRIDVCSDGQAALTYLHGPRNLSTRPDLVLLDVRLPEVDGIEVLNRIRADRRTARLPVVILSSSREKQDLMDCYDRGANSYVRKPVDFLRFVATARLLAQYWLGLNETVAS